MPRTTDELVYGVMTNDPAVDDTSVDLSPFILTANELVTEVCAPTVNGYSSERLELIERWLAAHCFILNRAINTRQVEGLRQQFQFKLGLVLQSTMYGQQALMLDTKGGLAQLSKLMEEGKKPVEIEMFHLGDDPCCHTHCCD